MLGCWRRVVTERRATVLTLEAEEGFGKSRLFEEFAARARLDGAAVAALRAVEADATVPGSVLLGLARSGLLEAPGVAAAPPSALAALAARLVEWAERFPAAAGQTLDVGAAFIEIGRAVAEEGPLVLLLDDAQWADGESLQLLTALIRDLAVLPVLLAVAARPRPNRVELDLIRSQIGRDLTGDLLILGPLTTSALHALVRWRFPAYSETQADRLARRLAGDSAGSPFIAVELLQAVALGLDLEGGGVWPEPDRTETDTMPGSLPSNLVAAIRIRFGRLGAAAREVLKVAAVLPGPITATRLSRVTGLDASRLAEGLDEAEWVRWLAADARGYDFPARILREVIERDMSTPGQRRRIREADGKSG
jgi:predicted ATPase